MKYLFGFLVLFSAHASATDFQGVCTGNRGAVALSLFTRDERLFLRYLNQAGGEDFPIYEGIVTRRSLGYIALAEEELRELDQEVVVSWPIKACQFNPERPQLVSCDGEAQMHVPQGAKIKSLGFSTGIVTEERRTQMFESLKLRWTLEGEGLIHLLAMTFDPKACQFRLK